MFKLIEPVWGEHFLRFLYQWTHSSAFLMTLVPLFADIFVFFYPVFLVAIYIYAIIKKNIEYKTAAIRSFLATLSTVIVNILIQCVVDKQRPSVIL